MGRTIGIIGYGRIGREVAVRAAGLKCRVLAANRSPAANSAPATPHSSSSTEATADRRWSAVAANLDRFARGEKLENIVLQTCRERFAN